MRKFLFPVVVFSAIVAGFASCQKESPAPDEGPRELHFIVKATQNPNTKTTLTFDGDKTYTPGWSADDVLGAFLGSTTIDNNKKSVDMTLSNTAGAGTTATFEGSTVAEGDGKFVAFYPASAFEKGYNDGTIGLNIGATSDYIQYPTKDAPDPTCNILVSKECDYVSDGTTVLIDDLFFTRPLSVLKVNLIGSYAANQEISSFTMSVSMGTLSGRVSIDLSDASIKSWTSPKTYAKAEYSSSKPAINKDAVYLIVNPTTITSGTTVTVEAETENYSIEKSFTLDSDMSFPANGIAVLNLSIAESNCTPKEAFTPKTYNKISSANDLSDGEYIICMQSEGEETVYYLENTVKTKPGGKAFATGIELSADKETITISSKTITDATWSFTAVDGGYSITPTSNDKAGLGTTSSNDGLTCQTTYSGKAWTIVDDDTYNWTFKYIATNRYLVVYSIANPRTYTSSSTNANGVFFLYQLENNLTPLSAPTGLAVSGMTLSWSAVEGAGSYIVTINGSTSTVETTSKVYDGVAGYYDVSVVAVPTDKDTYKNSPESTLAGAKFGTPALPTPTLTAGGVTTTSVTADWTADEKATNGYHCEIYNASTKEAEKDVAAGVGTVTFTGLTEDVTYTVKVNAKEVTGDKPYAASGVATIDLTPDGMHAEDVTTAGSYIISDLEVKAVMGTGQFIAGDNTGLVYVYKSNHNLAVGSIITINGAASAYSNNGGILQFSSPEITTQSAGNGTATHGTAIVVSDEYLSSYASSPVPVYIHASGLQSGQDITVGTKVLHLYSENTATDGKMVNVNGYLFGYSSRYTNYNFVATSIAEDTSIPTLSTNPVGGSTISWDDDVYGSNNAETITVSLNAAASGYTVSYTDSESAWTISDNGSGTITVYPNAANTSTTNAKNLNVTITHKDKAALSSTITLSQKKQSSGGSYTLTFATGSGDGTKASTSTACSTIVSTGSQYLSGNLASATNVYYAGNFGLKLGTSSASGNVKMNLSTSVTPTSIVIRAKRYNASKTATLKVNGSATQNITDDFTNLTFNISNEISYLELESSKYCWIESITVNY